jgi:hypothetical protein
MKSVLSWAWVLVLGIALLPGCFAPCLNPLWSPDTLAYNGDLLGTYNKGKLEIAKGPVDKSYKLTFRDDDGNITSEVTARLVRLGDHLFADQEQPFEREEVIKPAGLKVTHSINLITIDGTTITAWSFGRPPADNPTGDPVSDDDWMTRHGAPSAEITVRERGDTAHKTRGYCSLPTRDLQAFMRDNAKHMTFKAAEYTRDVEP